MPIWALVTNPPDLPTRPWCNVNFAYVSISSVIPLLLQTWIKAGYIWAFLLFLCRLGLLQVTAHFRVLVPRFTCMADHAVLQQPRNKGQPMSAKCILGSTEVCLRRWPLINTRTPVVLPATCAQIPFSSWTALDMFFAAVLLADLFVNCEQSEVLHRTMLSPSRRQPQRQCFEFFATKHTCLWDVALLAR